MSRMERQGIFPELPQGWATTEGSGWGEPSRPPLDTEEETEMQGLPAELDLLPQG